MAAASPPRSPWPAALAVAAAACLPYANVLVNGFSLDDAYLVLGNGAIRSLRGIPGFFAGAWGGDLASGFYGRMNAGYYRPLVMTLFALEHAAFGDAPAGWHAVSILLHAAASLLVWSCARRLLPGRPVPALAAAALFAVHPVHTEVLSPATYQTTLLAALGTLGAFRLHLGPASRARPFLVALACAAGLLAKESALVAPALIVAHDLLLRPEPWRARLAAWGPLAVACTAYLLVRAAVLDGGGLSFFGAAPWHVRALTMLGVAALYARLLAVPHPLCPFYDWYIVPPVVTPLDPGALGGLALLLLVPWAAWLLARSGHRMAALSLLWVPIGLAPVSQVVPILNVAAERFLYVPSAGLALLAGWVVARGGRRAAWVAAVVCLVFAGLTWRRNGDWRDDTTLYLATARDFPETPTPHIGLAARYEEAGDREAALRHLAEERLRDPRIPGPWRDAARLLRGLGREEEAARLDRQAAGAGN